MLPGDIGDDVSPALLIEIRIAAVYARGESVEHLQVRLRGYGREVECPVAVLHAEFIYEMRSESGRQTSHQRLVAKIVVLKAGRQIKTVIERRDIVQTPVIEKVTQEQVFVIRKRVVQLARA